MAKTGALGFPRPCSTEIFTCRSAFSLVDAVSLRRYWILSSRCCFTLNTRQGDPEERPILATCSPFDTAQQSRNLKLRREHSNLWKRPQNCVLPFDGGAMGYGICSTSRYFTQEKIGRSYLSTFVPHYCLGFSKAAMAVSPTSPYFTTCKRFGRGVN